MFVRMSTRGTYHFVVDGFGLAQSCQCASLRFMAKNVEVALLTIGQIVSRVEFRGMRCDGS